jgi:hypothetical protein
VETWKHGDVENCGNGHGDMEPWRHRDWRNGHGDMVMETWTWRHEHGDVDMET